MPDLWCKRRGRHQPQRKAESEIRPKARREAVESRSASRRLTPLERAGGLRRRGMTPIILQMRSNLWASLLHAHPSQPSRIAAKTTRGGFELFPAMLATHRKK